MSKYVHSGCLVSSAGVGIQQIRMKNTQAVVKQRLPENLVNILYADVPVLGIKIEFKQSIASTSKGYYKMIRHRNSLIRLQHVWSQVCCQSGCSHRLPFMLTKQNDDYVVEFGY